MIVVAVYGADADFVAQLDAMFGQADDLPRLRFLRPGDTNQQHTHVLLINTAVPGPASAHVGPTRTLHMSMEPHCFLRLTPAYARRVTQNTRMSVLGAPHPLLPRSRAGFVPIPSKGFYKWREYAQHTPWFETTSTSTSTSTTGTTNSKIPRISLALSAKQQTAGHRYRHALARALLKTNLPVDIWGTGCDAVRAAALCVDKLDVDSLTGPRLCGAFRDCEPFDRSVYAYTVAIENCVQGHYFTEKVSLPIFCGVTPLYLGSPHIDTYFPYDTVRPLTGQLADDVALITQVVSELEHADDARMRSLEAARMYFQTRWHFGRQLAENYFSS